MGVKRVWSVADLMSSLRGKFERPPEANLAVRVTPEVAAAEWRWHSDNERRRRKGCPCGGPAQVARAYHDVMGTVPFLWWTCEDHAGASGFRSVRHDGVLISSTAVYSHDEPCPLGEYLGSGGPIGGPPTHFECSHRTHEGASA